MVQIRLSGLLVSCFLALTLMGAGCGARPGGAARTQRVNEDARILKEFNDRVQEYAKLHKRMAAGLPPLKNKADAASIAAHRQALASALRAARPDAKQGDIFFPAAESYFLRILHGKLQGPGTSSTRAAIMESNPKKVPLRVNDPYPEAAPLSTVPPALLLNLPRLPEELEYRFIDRHLILRDTQANLLVDFILGVVP